MNVTIRRATAEDYRPLCDLFNELDALHRDHLPRLFQKPAGPVREEEYYRGLLADENIGLFVAEVEGRPVGFLHAVVRETPPIPVFVPRRYAVIDSLAVKAEFQHRGIGRILMDAVHDWATARGATAIELNVYEFNKTAIAFYQSLGYETLSRKMSKTLR